MSLVLLLLTLSTSAFTQEWKKWSLVKDCSILDINGKMLRSFPGKYCLFLPDGSYISTENEHIRRINPDNEILWQVNEPIHHQNKFSHDGKRILGLSSAIYVTPKEEKSREDTFVVMDLDGKVLHKQSASAILNKMKVLFLPWKGKEKIQGISSEISHFNSIQEIPPQTSTKGRPDWLKAGNIVVSGLRQGVFVLSPDLQKVLHHRYFIQTHKHAVHDAQITANGTFLYYANLVANSSLKDTSDPFGGTQEKLYSAVYETDVDDKIVNQFTANPVELFYSWACGGVQELDKDTWLFNHILVGTYIYSKSQKKVLMMTVQANADWMKFSGVQEVKAMDLTKFFTFWK